MPSTGKTPCSPNIVGKRRAGHGACSEYKHRERRGLGHHMRLGKAADDPPVKGHCRASLLGKSPGSDSFSVEFYLRFWCLLGQDLTDTLNHCFRTGFLSNSQKTGILRLLYKKDDPLSLKNWRPISLLNTDYKIATKVLANRLRRVLPGILHADQTCGVPGRSIFENLFLTRDTLDYIDKKNISAVMITLDQEKAFDRVNHAFLQRVLDRFNFGPDFRRWVSVVYTDITSSVLNNGWLSKPFHIQRGVRQGCPLSPLLYCLVVETLGQIIRNDDLTEGIRIPGSPNTQNKVSQYADDTTLILANDFSVNRAFNLINVYERGSGSKLNKTKTEGLWLGSQAGRTSGPVNITWVTDNIKSLGIFFGNTHADNANWVSRVEKLEKRLNLWKMRTLSLKGKALIINALGASGLWYVATVLPMPEWVFTRIERAIWEFLWHGKTELVKRTTCRRPCDLGGLSVVHALEKSRALKLRWVPHVGDDSYTAKWVHLARYWVGFPLSRRMKGWSFLRANNLPKHLGGNPPLVYQSILTAVDRIGFDFDLLPDHHVKTFYRFLLDWRGFLPCIGAWERDLSISLRTASLWKNIYGGLCTNRERDIAWKIAHRIVKTRAFLHGWQRLNVPNCCAVCNVPETIPHVFHECTNALPVWGWVSPIIDKIYGYHVPLTSPIILLGHGLPHLPSDGPAFRLGLCILRITLGELWAVRNEITFEHKVITPDQTIRRITARVKHRLYAAFHLNSRPDFSKQWAVNNALVTVRNEHLHFSF